MGPLLLAVLAAAPAIELSPDALCASELRASGLKFETNGAVMLRLTPGQLTLTSRSGEVILRRELGNGTCAELSRASRVVIERWAQQLGPMTIDAGLPAATVTSAPKKRPPRAQGSFDAGAAAENPDAGSKPDQFIATDERAPSDAGSEPDQPIVEDIDAGVVVVDEPIHEDAGVTVDVVRERVATELEGFVGGGLVTPAYSSPVGPVLSADIALILARHVRLGLVGLFDFGGSTSLVDDQHRERGTFTTRGGAALAHGAWCFNWPVRACGGLVVGAHLDEGRTTGSFVFQSTVARTAAFTFGPSIQIAWLPNTLHLAFDATLLISPQPSTFQVIGLSPSSLSLPAFQGLFRLSIGLGNSR